MTTELYILIAMGVLAWFLAQLPALGKISVAGNRDTEPPRHPGSGAPSGPSAT